MNKFKQIYLLVFAMCLTLASTAQDVTINTDVAAELTVCGDSKSFSIDLTNNTTGTLTSVTLNIDFPSGISYETGSITETTQGQSYGVTESNISDLSDIDLAIGNLQKIVRFP